MSKVTDNGGARARADSRDIECVICKQAIAGVVYFGRIGRPVCADCAIEVKWQGLLASYARFDRDPPDRDENMPALRLPTTSHCEACGRSMAWLNWRLATVTACSWECRWERDKAQRRVVHEQKTCEACGEMFTPKRSDARTCSDRCRKRLQRSRISTRGAARS